MLFSCNKKSLIRLERNPNTQPRTDCSVCGQNIRFLSLIANCEPINLAPYIGPAGIRNLSKMNQVCDNCDCLGPMLCRLRTAGVPSTTVESKLGFESLGVPKSRLTGPVVWRIICRSQTPEKRNNLSPSPGCRCDL